jgi:hypothetical protein
MISGKKRNAANSFFDNTLRESFTNLLEVTIQTLIGNKVSEDQAKANH